MPGAVNEEEQLKAVQHHEMLCRKEDAFDEAATLLWRESREQAIDM